MAKPQSTDLKKIMRHHRMMLDVCNDPDLDADAKLFVLLAISRWSDSQPTGIRRIGKARNNIREIADLAGESLWWAQKVIRNDIPRYRAPVPEHRTCTAPMIRREGECRRPVIKSGTAYDPITGEGTWYGFCSRHRNHKDDWTIQQQNKEWHTNGCPSPPPNTGGVLRRYLKTDWDAYYQWADPYITPLEGAKPPTLPKPNLRLITGAMWTSTAATAARNGTPQAAPAVLHAMSFMWLHDTNHNRRPRTDG